MINPTTCTRELDEVIVVYPSLGPFAADRVGAGTGVLLPSALLEAVEEAGHGEVRDLARFVGVDLRDDADPNANSRIEQQLRLARPERHQPVADVPPSHRRCSSASRSA